MIARARRAFTALPVMMRVGLVLAGLGGLIDIGYHLGQGTPGVGHDTVAFIGHLVTLVGMVVTMLGLFGAAHTRRSVSPQQPPKGELR